MYMNGHQRSDRLLRHNTVITYTPALHSTVKGLEPHGSRKVMHHREKAQLEQGLPPSNPQLPPMTRSAILQSAGGGFLTLHMVRISLVAGDRSTVAFGNAV
jgi:hypothetical protein